VRPSSLRGVTTTNPAPVPHVPAERKLHPDDLYTPCDPGVFDFESTADLHDLSGVVGQERAVDALRFATGMLYAAGSRICRDLNLVRNLHFSVHELLNRTSRVMTHLTDRLFRELWRTVERKKLASKEFRFSESEGWVRVEHRGKRRYYPLTHEIGVLLSGDLRRGAFD
jgi:hypothetical protein